MAAAEVVQGEVCAMEMVKEDETSRKTEGLRECPVLNAAPPPSSTLAKWWQYQLGLLVLPPLGRVSFIEIFEI